MRQLDIFQTYYDNEGFPLYGRLRFFDSDGNPANVYDESGDTSLGTYVLTDGTGRTSQIVMLSDIDYDIYFDKWIGPGQIDVTSDEGWLLEVGHAKSINTKMTEEIEGGNVYSANTIFDLREVYPDSIGTNNVILLGYNTPGDKHPVNYIWNSESTDTDNGGSVIKVDGVETGRWEISLLGEEVDVRDFGAFPAQSSNILSAAQASKVLIASQYATQTGKRLFFGGIGYYNVSGLSLNNISANPNVMLMCATNSEVTIYNCDPSVKLYSKDSANGTFNVHGDILKTSQDIGNLGGVRFNPKMRFIIDSVAWHPSSNGKSFSGVDIVVNEITDSPLEFTGCNIISSSKLKASGTNTLKFTECALSESMFSSGNNLAKCTFINCTVLDWDNVVFLTSVDTSGYYDFKGRTYTGSTLPAGEYTNGQFVTNITSDATLLSFRNCSLGNITLLVGKFKNCTLNGTVTAYSQVPNSCSVTFEDCEVNGNVKANIVEGIRSSFSTSVEAVDSATMIDCSILNSISGKNLVMKGTNSGVGAFVNFTGSIKINDCVVGYNLSGADVDATNTTVNGKIRIKDKPGNAPSMLKIRNCNVKSIYGSSSTHPVNWDINGLTLTESVDESILEPGSYIEGGSNIAINVIGAVSHSMVPVGDSIRYDGNIAFAGGLNAIGNTTISNLYLTGESLIGLSSSEAKKVYATTPHILLDMPATGIGSKICLVRNSSAGAATLAVAFSHIATDTIGVCDNFTTIQLLMGETAIVASLGSTSTGHYGNYNNWLYLGKLKVN